MIRLKQFLLVFALGLAFPGLGKAETGAPELQQAVDQYQSTLATLYKEEIRIERADDSIQAMNQLADVTNKLTKAFMAYAVKNQNVMHSPLPPIVTTAIQAPEQLRGKYVAIPRTMNLLQKRYPDHPEVQLAYRHLAEAQEAFEQTVMTAGSPRKTSIF